MENKKIFFQIQRGSQFDIIINNSSMRTKVFNLIPLPVMNKILLTFPTIYKMKIVNYESVLTLNNGIQELLNQINKVKNIEKVGPDFISTGNIGQYGKWNNL